MTDLSGPQALNKASVTASSVDDDVRKPLRQGERWFVVHTLVHREASAAFQLRRQSFRVFLPQRLKSRRHARKIETVRAPFFPRYLFVAMDLERDTWWVVNGTIGVSRLIMGGNLPKPVPQGVVETLLERADCDGLCSSGSEANLEVGRRAEIAVGPFADQIGVLQRLDDAGRVRLLLEIMGGRICVDVPSRALTPVR